MISGLQQIQKRFAQTEALSITDTRFADYIKYSLEWTNSVKGWAYCLMDVCIEG
jgi:hypothetical protein